MIGLTNLLFMASLLVKMCLFFVAQASISQPRMLLSRCQEEYPDDFARTEASGENREGVIESEGFSWGGVFNRPWCILK